MGLDFIQKAAPSFKKSWDEARIDLATADLFTRHPQNLECSALFDIAQNRNLTEGEKLTIETQGESLVARRGLTEVARSNTPSSKLRKALEESCGIAIGTVDQIYQEASVAEVLLC